MKFYRESWRGENPNKREDHDQDQPTAQPSIMKALDAERNHAPKREHENERGDYCPQPDLQHEGRGFLAVEQFWIGHLLLQFGVLADKCANHDTRRNRNGDNDASQNKKAEPPFRAADSSLEGK